MKNMKQKMKLHVIINHFVLQQKIDHKLVGATCFSEVYVDELVVKEEHRGKNIWSQLICKIF